MDDSISSEIEIFCTLLILWKSINAYKGVGFQEPILWNIRYKENIYL